MAKWENISRIGWKCTECGYYFVGNDEKMRGAMECRYCKSPMTNAIERTPNHIENIALKNPSKKC